jgi:hypothetical protein
MNGQGEHHGAGAGHDCLDCPFGLTIVMVSANCSKMNHLLKEREVSAKSNGGKLCVIVQQEALWDDTMVSTY